MKIKNVQFNPEKLFFTSDTHFFHKNILKYCDRPFENTREMNQTLINNWNAKVPKDGIVFHLGDFSLTAKPKELDTLINSLNGKIYLIIGNHEKDALRTEYVRSHFAGIHDVAEIYIKDDEITYGEQHIVMCHYPMIVWNGSHRGSWQLFGHVHGGLSNKGEIKHSPTQLDVGVDCHDYKPISYQEVKELITQQAMKKQ
jgi:calcineurin-like phosphoesterase family protein